MWIDKPNGEGGDDLHLRVVRESPGPSSCWLVGFVNLKILSHDLGIKWRTIVKAHTPSQVEFKRSDIAPAPVRRQDSLRFAIQNFYQWLEDQIVDMCKWPNMPPKGKLKI